MTIPNFFRLMLLSAVVMELDKIFIIFGNDVEIKSLDG